MKKLILIVIVILASGCGTMRYRVTMEKGQKPKARL